jgi:hypothetical protein
VPKRRTIKEYGGVVANFHSFLSSVLRASVRSTLRPLYPWEENKDKEDEKREANSHSSLYWSGWAAGAVTKRSCLVATFIITIQ